MVYISIYLHNSQQMSAYEEEVKEYLINGSIHTQCAEEGII
jgi:hypothetical protein